ncbi:MAG: tetratricopeptide repeat protein [Chloroflexota bacterium]|nr:tetratricopeptide repeat protein [Chloroflexota bacterium]
MQDERLDTRSTASSVGQTPLPRPSLRDILLGLIMVASLALAVARAWNNPEVEGRIRVREAYALLDEGRYTQAVAQLEDTLLIYDEPEARLALSYAYLARRDLERAERQARLVVGSRRLDMLPAGWTQLGRVLQAAGRPQDALDAWNRAVRAAEPYRGIPRIEADVRSAMWNTAMFHWSRGEWEAARDVLEDLSTGEDIYGFSASVKLAQLFAANDSSRAGLLLDDLEQAPPAPTPMTGSALTRVPTTPNLRVPGLSEGLSPADRQSLANDLRNTLSEASNLSGDNDLDKRLLWSSAYLQQGEPRLALVQAELAVQLHPEQGRAISQYGLALVATRNIDGALIQLEKAVSLEPQLPLPHNALAQLYMQKRRWDGALAEIDALQRLQPTSATPHMLRGEYHRLRGEYKHAEEAFFQAAAIQKGLGAQRGEPDAQLTLALFYIDVTGEGCLRGLAPAQESVAAHPDEPASLDAVGWAFALCERPQEALSPLEEAVSRVPDNPRYRYHLGRVYTQLERYADAREQYTRVLDFDPGGSWTGLAVTELSKLPR